MKNTTRSIVRRFRNRRFELATLLAVSGAAACAAAPATSSDNGKVGKTASALITTAEGAAVAQKAIDFMVPDAIAFTQGSHCLSCHRQPDVLISSSTAAALLPGIVLDRSTATGTGFIADLVVNNQEGDGKWTNGGGSPNSMSAESLWAISGYARAGGDVDVLPSIKRGLLWAVPMAQTWSFADDGGPFANQNRTMFPNDFAEAPQMWDWYLPTTQMVFATRTLLDLDGTLSAADVTALSAQQVSFTDTLEGATMRALHTSTVQQLSLAAIAMSESGRSSTENGQAIGAELIARQTPGEGWGDANLPDGALQSVNALTTGQALYALCRLGIRPRKSETVNTGLDWLSAQQQNNGAWALPGHDLDVATSWALLSIACIANATGSAEFNPLTGSSSPDAPVVQTITTTLNITNTAGDTRVATIGVTGGPTGTTAVVTPSTLSMAADATAPVSVTITLPAGLAQTTSYPFEASVNFAAGGVSPPSHVTAKYTVAVGTTPNAALSATKMALVHPPTTVAQGAAVKLSANVLDVLGHPVQNGTVTFTVDGVVVGTATIVNGVFATTWTVPTGLSVGQHKLHIAFSGDDTVGMLDTTDADQIFDVTAPAPVDAGASTSVSCVTDAGDSTGTTFAAVANEGAAVVSLTGGGGCNVTRESGTPDLASVGVLGLALAAVRRIRRKAKKA